MQFLLEGRVTSVKMRRYIQSAGNHFNCQGYVINTTTNQVYGEATGSTNALAMFSKWIHGEWLPKRFSNLKPPPVGLLCYPELARVDSVQSLMSLTDSSTAAPPTAAPTTTPTAAATTTNETFHTVRDPTQALSLEQTMPLEWTTAVRSYWIPPVIMAPMVRGSELAYRMLGRKYGCSAAYSPMMGSVEVLNGNAAHRLMTCPEDRPLYVQLMGNQPKQVAAAAVKIIKDLNGQLDGIDFNLGCPQEVADKGNFGAFLATRNPDLAVECLRELSKALSTLSIHPIRSPATGNQTTTSIRPRVSTKIRLFPSTQETIQFAKRLEEAGCDVLAVHCRRPGEKHNGEPDYASGALLVEALDIPVVINGGINNGQKACAVMKETNCHSVMVAQSLLENHRMLVDVNACAGELAAEYLANCVRWPPPSPLYIRKHLRWIFRKELQPVRTSNPEEYKAQFKSWRPKLWTFLVRPYLTDMIQFQQVVHMYCLLSKIVVPDSLLKLKLEAPTFKSIKAAKNDDVAPFSSVSSSSSSSSSSGASAAVQCTKKRKLDEGAASREDGGRKEKDTRTQ